MSRGVLVLAWLSAASVTLAGQSVPASADGRVNVWREAVRNHTPGELDESARAVEQWSRFDLIQAATVVRKGWGPGAEADSLLIRAAMLHADIAILHRTESGYHLPSNGTTPASVHDGQQVGRLTGIVHWDVARTLLNLQPKPLDGPRVRLWYQATSAFLQSWNEDNELEPHLQRGRLLFPDDPVLLLYAGTMHEGYADPKIQNVSGKLVLAPGRRAPFGNELFELNAAERCFRRAMALDPRVVEARIRLGHVLGLLGRHADAAHELEQARSQPLPALLDYFALSLLGREQFILGRVVEAQAAFRQAVLLYPGAQSPRLGLSQVARDAGDERGALAELAMLEHPSQDASRDDPLWRYASLHEPSAEILIGELRRSLGR